MKHSPLSPYFLALFAIVASACSKRVPRVEGAIVSAADAGASVGLASAVQALVNPEKLPVYSGPTGAVEGVVYVTGPSAPEAPPSGTYALCPAAARTRAKLFREAAPTSDGRRPLGDALVAVTGYHGFYLAERHEAREVIIDDCAAAPRTIDVTIGQRLEFINRTNALFAPSIEAEPTIAVMAAGKATGPIQLYPQKPGYFALRDLLGGAFASADLYVLLHPLHAVSDSSGHFRIEGVPVGKLQAFARLPSIRRESAAPVEVRAGETAHIDLTIAYAPEPTAVSTTERTKPVH